jgi:heptose I phosphotransferase
VYLHTELKKNFTDNVSLFAQIMALAGETFRHQDGRRTQRLQINGKAYFIKQHKGVGWKEIIKNLFQLRFPVLSAKNEWRAIQKLAALNIAVPTVVGFGMRGMNPAKLQSFILMEELAPTISLETLSHQWKNAPPSFLEKRNLIKAVATIARTMHEHGINHRDFYLCHFLLDQASPSLKLYLIDLHRAQIRRKTPTRWIMKDLSGLYFSCAHLKLTKRDLLHFVKIYRQKPLRQLFNTEKAFWQKVQLRGTTYRDHTQSA